MQDPVWREISTTSTEHSLWVCRLTIRWNACNNTQQKRKVIIIDISLIIFLKSCQTVEATPFCTLHSLKTPESELTRIWVPGGPNHFGVSLTRNPCQCVPESESKSPLLNKFLVTMTRFQFEPSAVKGPTQHQPGLFRANADSKRDCDSLLARVL